jgi:hypothetical protein
MTNPLSFDTATPAVNDVPVSVAAYPHIEHLLYWIQAREAMRLAKKVARRRRGRRIRSSTNIGFAVRSARMISCRNGSARIG